MKTKWKSEHEFADGTGDLYYRCQCPQISADKVRPDALYTLFYMPTTHKLWFWDATKDASVTTRMTCESWEQAELVKSMLTSGESHWMEPA